MFLKVWFSLERARLKNAFWTKPKGLVTILLISCRKKLFFEFLVNFGGQNIQYLIKIGS